MKMHRVAIGIAAILLLIGLEYKTAFIETYSQGEWSVGANKVALTFDDCPYEPYTSQILDTLTQYNVKATFFLIGERVIDSPEIVKKVVKEGHSVGNHGYSDKKPSILGEDETAKGITKTQDIMEEITGIRPEIFRLPSGIPNREIKQVIDEEGMRIIFADVFILNERERSKDDIVEYVITNTSSGCIILLHGDHQEIVGGLPLIIRGLRRKGLKFVTI